MISEKGLSMRPSGKHLIILALLAGCLTVSCTKRKPEEIDYAPNSPYNPYPPDSSTNIDHTTTDVTLRWTATDPNSGDVLTYDVFFDTLNPPVAKAASGLTSPSFFIPGLAYHTTYYWRLYISDDAGVTTSGPVWCFTTLPHPNQAPAIPSYLSPVPDSVGTYPTLTLAWSSADPDGSTDTVDYLIQLGPTSPPAPYGSSFLQQFEASCLNYSTVYYWRIVATDNHGAVSTGQIAKFTTRISPWCLKAPMPLVRRGFTTAVYDNKIYVIGGKDESGTPTGTLQIYDPLADAWTIHPSMPTPRFDLAAAACSGMVYAFGGIDGNGDAVTTCEEYNPVSDSWSTKLPMFTSRYGLIAQTVGRYIYAIGGYEYRISQTPLIVEAYKPADNTWTRLWRRPIFPRRYNHPPGRMYMASAVIDSQIYLAGGWSPWTNSYDNRLEVYNPATNKVSFLGAIPTNRNRGFGAASGTDLYLIGGYNGAYMRRVERYLSSSGAWALRGDMLNSRSACGGGLVNGCIYIVGGYNDNNVTVTEEYRLAEDP